MYGERERFEIGKGLGGCDQPGQRAAIKHCIVFLKALSIVILVLLLQQLIRQTSRASWFDKCSQKAIFNAEGLKLTVDLRKIYLSTENDENK